MLASEFLAIRIDPINIGLNIGYHIDFGDPCRIGVDFLLRYPTLLKQQYPRRVLTTGAVRVRSAENVHVSAAINGCEDTANNGRA